MFFRVVSCNSPQRFTSGSLYTSMTMRQDTFRVSSYTAVVANNGDIYDTLRLLNLNFRVDFAFLCSIVVNLV